MVKYILSVDGGGIRGIIPAMILAEIERKANKPIAEMFDMMAGTSTGGIIVAGLSKRNSKGKPQYSANNLVDFYHRHGTFIFKSNFWRKKISSWLYNDQYSHENVESVLDNYFQESTIADVTNKLLITSYDIDNSCPFFFKSWKKDRNFLKLKDALRATTAAPTFFAPLRLTINEYDRVLIDGGIFANNPAACAYANARKLFPNDKIILLSLGCGEKRKSIKYGIAKTLGKLGWIRALIDIVFDSGISCVDYQLTQMMGRRYMRIQTKLTMASANMDDVTPKNMKYLQQEAEATIEENQNVIDKFVERRFGK